MLSKLSSNMMLHSLQARTFSRAQIMKKLNKSNISRKDFIKGELQSNPEFFKAYPHLQAIFSVNEEK